MSKQRGFEEVQEEKKRHVKKIQAHGQEVVIYPKTYIPQRSDVGSAGYDIATPVEVTILPGQTEIVWTNVKAYMQPDEVLQVFVRSSVGIKQGIVLANGTGIIDASYYSNDGNDGNIGIALHNTTGQAKIFGAGERIAQGIFTKYLLADVDSPANDKREGGIGSSGK